MVQGQSPEEDMEAVVEYFCPIWVSFQRLVDDHVVKRG